MNLKQNRLLVIDDEPQICRLIKRVATRLDFDVQEAFDISSAEEQMSSFEPTAIVLDLSIPGRDGASFLRDLAGGQCDVPILLISGLAGSALESAELLGAQHGLNVVGSLHKPLSLSGLDDALMAIQANERNERENGLLAAESIGRINTNFQPVFRLEETQCIVAGMRVTLPLFDSDEYRFVAPGSDSQCQMRLVRNITDNLLLETVSRLREWKKEGVSLFAIVALSPALLNDSGIPARLMALMAEFDIEPQMLVLDISCVNLGAIPGEVPDVLARLRADGFQLIYEFETLNATTMNQAHAASVTAIGIHPSILTACAKNMEALGLLQAMTSLAHRAGLTVWTHGISDPVQMKMAADAACDFAAGEYIALRMAGDQVISFALAGREARPWVVDPWPAGVLAPSIN